MTRLELRDHAFLMASAAVGTVLAVAAGVLLAWLIGVSEAEAHPATNTAGDPLGISYPSGCCLSAATSPTGDCAPIDDQYVTEGPDGYEINLPVGAHPKLKTKGFKGIVPYGTERQPISNDYHICLSTDGASRYCFFPKPGAV